MKGGKEEESKAMGPLFPRLHVKDTNKGGPRAPPRNKMALYEQFSVPSQRLNPVPSNSSRAAQKSGNLVASTASNQGYVQDKPYFSSFNTPQAPLVNSSEKVNTQFQSTDSGPHNSHPNHNREPLKPIRRESSLNAKRPPMVSESSSARPAEEPSRRNTKSPSRNPKLREDDDFTVPTLLEREAGNGNGNGNGLNLNLEERETGEEGESGDERESGEERETDLSPDDVVSAIGPKLFLKTRRAIVHQQRIFAVQVFELHRLIKVQHLIAGSPHVLLEDFTYLKKPTQPTKPIPTSNLITLPHERPHSEEPHKTKQKPDSPEKPTPPLPPITQQNNSHIGSNVANNSAANRAAPQDPPTQTNQNSQNSTNPWYQPNQWLVPVMSPLEGLVYKPYSGPCPPAGSFMAPFFPSCPSPATQTGEFMSPPFGVPVQVPVPVPVPGQSIGMVGLPNYFPPFSMPVMSPNPNLNANPNISTSAVEQVSHLVLSNNNVPNRNNNNNNNNNNHNNTERNNSRSSCNNMSQMNMWRIRNSRESELQGSTASSPFEKGENNNNNNNNTNNNNNNNSNSFHAHFFPMGMAGMDALANQHVTSGGPGGTPRVIRVVPHNARSATESVARIFQSIQKEKQQNS